MYASTAEPNSTAAGPGRAAHALLLETRRRQPRKNAVIWSCAAADNGYEIVEMPANFDYEYERVVTPLGPFGLALEHLTKDLLENSGIQAHSVSHRVKRKHSIIRKLEKGEGKRTLAGLTDLVGLRIITYFRDEVD